MTGGRIVCIVEGHGDVAAVPVLCSRVLAHLVKPDVIWHVDANPVRVPRSRLVDESVASPRRPPNLLGVGRALTLASARNPAGILVLCDADDDCPAAWGSAFGSAGQPWAAVATAGVMASREFESWYLSGLTEVELERARAKEPDRAPRDAKGAVRRIWPGYSESIHQAKLARSINLETAWRRSASFDKLVRSLAKLVGVAISAAR